MPSLDSDISDPLGTITLEEHRRQADAKPDIHFVLHQPRITDTAA